MSSVTFRGIIIRRQDVLRVLAEFDAAYGGGSNANNLEYLNIKPDLDH